MGRKLDGLYKICWNRSNSLDEELNILRFWFEIAYSRPNNRGLGDFTFFI